MDYDLAIATIKASKVPFGIVMMQLKHGIKPDKTCGGCSARLELHVNGVHHYCWRSYSQADLPENTLACGKWRNRETPEHN